MYSIYEIKNLTKNISYIGLTSNIKRREIRHFTDLETNRHHNSFLQKDYNLTGRYNFSFEVLHEEDCNEEKASSLEIEFIEKIDSYKNGYNQNPGGLGGHRGASNGGSHLLKTDVLAINATLEFVSRPGALLGEIFDLSVTSISRIKKGESHLLITQEYKSLPFKKRREIFDSFARNTNLLRRKAEKTISSSIRALSEFQVHCVFLNEEMGRIIPLKRLARYFNVRGYVLYSILNDINYKDYKYTYKEVSLKDKEKMASFLREEEKKNSRIAGTSLRKTNHNITEKII